MSFELTLSDVNPGFEVPLGPPKIKSNSTSITSSAKALPVSTLVPSKNVVVPVVETFKTSVANTVVNVITSENGEKNLEMQNLLLKKMELLK